VQADEVRDMLMMLFPDEKEIYLQDLPRSVPSTPVTSSGLQGSSVVVRITPDKLASAIIKFASPDAIRRECKNYDAYIFERFKTRRHPQMSRRKRFWNIGAVVYTSLGEDINDISQFQTYCRNHTPAEISAALRDFFFDVWHPLYADQSDLPGSLFEAYNRLWSRPDSAGPLAAKLDDWKRLDKFRSFEGLQGEFLEPRRWLADYTANSIWPNLRQCVVHGDLHGRNFFVDKHGNTWVIDFERTDLGHILADFVELEHDILRELASDLDLPTLFHLVMVLVTPLSINRKSQDDPLHFAAIVPGLVESVDESLRTKAEKVLQTIHELRKIAVELFKYENQQEYYWALLLDTLFGVQQLEKQGKASAANESIRVRELLMASILCQRLKNGQSEWPPNKWPSSQIRNEDKFAKPAMEKISMPTPYGTQVAKILFLAANPSDTTRLQLGKEYRDIREALQKAGQRNRFTLTNELAVRVGELIQLLLQYKPVIIHFSGHGSDAGEIILEDESGKSFPLPQEAVQKIFGVLNRNGNQIRCVILNACFTEQQALYIAEYVDIVVGITSEIGDTSAIRFASVFYASLGEGKSVQTAFELACVNIELHGLDFHDAVRLVTKKGISPDTYYLV
jgi:hypothetical protein